jgi:hypothetical protein
MPILDRGKGVEGDAQGRPLGAAGTHCNITRRKEREAECERLIRELQNATAKILTPSGLPPIRSGCRQIRDNRGY